MSYCYFTGFASQFCKCKLIFSLLLFVVIRSYGQENLVPNGSFEEYHYCPTTMDDFSVLDWYSPTTGSPNYLNSCNATDASVPQNSWGFQNANSGNAYIGFNTSDFDTSSTNAREYIQCKLISNLEKDELYEVSFYISRCDSSRRACNNIGMYLSENAISSLDNLVLPYIPQVLCETSIENDTSWVKMIDTVKAIGGEQFITIGVFSTNLNTTWINVNGSNCWSFESYYYVDDVSIKKLYDIPNIFTPNKDGINDFLDFSNFPYEIEVYNRWGIKVYSNKLTPYWYGTDENNSELIEGIYFYKIENKTGFIQLIR